MDIGNGMMRETFNRDEVMEVLPHRPPLLMLDSAWRLVGESFGSGCLYVDPDWSWLEGHYPGAPIMPGVLITEHMAQSACFFLLGRRSDVGAPLLARIEKVTFCAPAFPGDYLETEVVLERRIGNLNRIRAVTRRDGKVLAKGALLVGFADTQQDVAK